MSHSACRLPTPNTVWVRVVLKEQRVQAATRARSSGQSDAGLARRRDRARPRLDAPRRARAPRTRRQPPHASRGVDRATSRICSPRAARYSWRSALFMRCGAAARLRRRSLRYIHSVGADRA